MKTVKEVADELGIALKTVYRKINGVYFQQMTNHVKTINGRLMLDNVGIKIIKKSLARSNDNVKVEIPELNRRISTLDKEKVCHDNDNVKMTNDKLYETMFAQIQDLKERLTKSEMLVKSLTMTIKEQQSASNQQILNLQVLLKNEQEKTTKLLCNEIISEKEPSNQSESNVELKKEKFLKKFFWFLKKQS